MSKRYWLHRISHEWEIAYALLDQGYLSIGWSKFIDSDILKQIETGGETGFNQFMTVHGETSRSRWNLWYFAKFLPGDIVVVPLFDKEFMVVEVVERAFPISDLRGQSFITKTGESAYVSNDGIMCQADDRMYDIGFLVRVKPLKDRPIKRSFADAKLISRMKMRQTNGDISDVADSIDAAIQAESPISIHDRLTDAVTVDIQNVIRQHITPDNLERMVCWYMKKQGASNVWIPAKNESGKMNGADADVIAEFEALRVIFYIQVKKHEGTTDGWAIQQISEYTEQKQNDATDYTYIPWAITTAEFSQDTVQDAKAKGVRLIGGNDFIKMLIDCGIGDIDSAF